MKDSVKTLINEAIEQDVISLEEYSSSLEGYAAIKIKKENLEEKMIKLRREMKNLWIAIKNDDGKTAMKKVCHLQTSAFYTICEAVALAAACENYKLSLNEGVENVL